MSTKPRRRAVGPPGARPAQEEPLPERREDAGQDRRDLERYLEERPPHHDPR